MRFVIGGIAGRRFGRKYGLGCLLFHEFDDGQENFGLLLPFPQQKAMVADGGNTAGVDRGGDFLVADSGDEQTDQASLQFCQSGPAFVEFQ